LGSYGYGGHVERGTHDQSQGGGVSKTGCRGLVLVFHFKVLHRANGLASWGRMGLKISTGRLLSIVLLL